MKRKRIPEVKTITIHGSKFDSGKIIEEKIRKALPRVRKPRSVSWDNNGTKNYACMDSDEHCAIGSFYETGVAEIYCERDAHKLIGFLRRYIAWLEQERKKK